MPRCIERLILVELAVEPISEEVLMHVQSQLLEQFRKYTSATEYFELLALQRPLADTVALQQFAIKSLKMNPAGTYILKCDPLIQQRQKPERRSSLARQKELLAHLTCRCLFVKGSGSAIVRRTAAENVVRSLRGIAYCDVEGAGHAVMIDRPQEFYAAISRFLLSDLRTTSAIPTTLTKFP